MSVLVCQFQGRFGNQCLQYLFARGFSEAFGYELRTEPWVGERVFQIEHKRPDIGANEIDLFKTYNEAELAAGCAFSKYIENMPFWGTNRPNINFRGYAQNQFSVGWYSKRDAQRWLKLRPEIEAACRSIKLGVENNGPIDIVVCHRRVGDYAGYSYPIVSERSYHFAMAAFGIELENFKMLTEERPTNHAGLPNDLSFIADFYRMMTAPTLLRGNSTFSWLAALLGNGLVLSPVIDGLEGGKEHECRFVAGNHPRLANFEFTTEMFVNP